MSPHAHYWLSFLAAVAGWTGAWIAESSFMPESWRTDLFNAVEARAGVPVAAVLDIIIAYGFMVLCSFLAYIVVAKYVPARCPECRAPAAFRRRPDGGWMNVYSVDFVCRACGAKTHVEIRSPD